MRSSASLLFALLFVLACGDDSTDVPTEDAGPMVEEDAFVGDPDGGPAAYLGLCDPEADPGEFPAPDAWGPNHGPGGPAVTFSEGELYENCAFLDGGELDEDHHNLVLMYDGYLLMPWAVDVSLDGQAGGLSFFDFSSPCAPVHRGTGVNVYMRESHTVGFSSLNGEWAVTALLGPTIFDSGVQFWDVSDTSAPTWVADALNPDPAVQGVIDSYVFTTMSTFWEVPFVYAGASDNGVFIFDATDPRSAEPVGQYLFEPTMRVGQVQVVGNLLVATATKGSRTVLLDISDPTNPQPIPGGDFLARDASGEPRDAYFTSFTGGRVHYAVKDGGGGILVYDVSDPSSPTFVGERFSDGSGGYVFVKDDLAFVGESSFTAIYDMSDPSDITEVVRLDLEGELDTITPIGNVAVQSVDADAVDGQASTVTPYALEPDADPPEVTFAWPPDGATALPATSRFGVTFSEFIDIKSAFEGSFRFYETDTGRRVPGTVSAQESIVNFHPFCPLEPGTSYTLEVPAGGIVDYNGNAIAEPFMATFETL